MSKKALVTGGAGFIGSHLTDLLLKNGYQVTVVDSLVTGRLSNLEPIDRPGLTWLQADINQLPLLLEDENFRNESWDEIYNLASPASPIDFSRIPLTILDTAMIGHRHLLELAHTMRSRILFASSSEVYGDPLVHPQTEAYFGNVNPIGPRSCYDEAKRIGETLTYVYQRLHGVNIRVARIFNTYGPRMRPNDGRIIPNFFVQSLQNQALTVYGDGRQTRSFCYVTDLVRGLWKLMQSQEQSPVNLGNPEEHTVLEMANLINQITGNTTPVRHLPLPENDPKLRRPDISRAQDSLGWQPLRSLMDGLRDCLPYFDSELKKSPQGIVTPTLSATPHPS